MEWETSGLIAASLLNSPMAVGPLTSLRTQDFSWLLLKGILVRIHPRGTYFISQILCVPKFLDKCFVIIL